MTIHMDDQIGEIVARDYRTAAIFKASDIDFCCRGKRKLEVLRSDHTEEGDLWRMITQRIDQLGHSCNTANVTFALLHEFEEDLHQHIHLENNILFPAALGIVEEKSKAQQS